MIFGFITFEIQTILNGKVSRFAVSEWNQKSECLALNITNTKTKMQELSRLLSKVSRY